MEKKHGWYYKYDAEESARRFILQARISKGIAITIAFAMLILLLLDNSLGDIKLLIGYLAMIGYFIFTFILRGQVLNILYMECDPEKMLKFDSIIETYAKREQIKMAYLLRKALVCLYLNDKHDEGLEYLKQVDFPKKKFTTEVSRLACYGAYAYQKNDRESFNRIKQDMEQLPSVMKHNERQMKIYRTQMEYMQMRELIWDGKKDEARHLINKLLSEQMNAGGLEINRVVFHMRLAELDMEAGETNNAKVHLEYVISHGNTLGMVKDAEKILQSME